VYKYSYKNRLIKPRLIANIKEVQQRLYASIKMGTTPRLVEAVG